MRDIEDREFTLGVVGAGAMGAGIVQVAAQNGIAVRVHDAAPGAAQAAKSAVGKRLARLVEKGRLAEADADAAQARIEAAQNIEDLAPCDVVIEAIIEDIDAKVTVFAALEEIVAPDAILASNTSSLPIGAIAARLNHKARVAGMHFFNPVPLMKLVEVIPGPDTTDAVIAQVTALAERMGRTPVEVTDTPGFLVNFGGRAYQTEALAILQERVATPAQVDAVMRDCLGFRMGPFELMDLTGIDVNYPVSAFVHGAMFSDPRLRSTARHKYMLDTGQLGRKAGRGFYDHAEGAARPSPDAASDAAPCAAVFVPEGHADARALIEECGAQALDADDGAAPILVTLIGEDCSAHAARTGLDAARLVALDPLGDTSARVTLMTPPGADSALRDALIARIAPQRAVTLIDDSPGFVAQRIAAMVCNLGCEMAQMGLAAPEGIDTAMRLGLNYPQGPLAMTDAIGAEAVLDILRALQWLTGDDRYRPSQWLRRRAQLGLSALTA
ncbi:3-hydroxyacyl-CoA dehydrogenase [Roseovarius spongiae]|uniref:3-hydroxyacyl-CoA dehydrogenase n=1 Tax=Roseovarius spongiae TaxID=2320272 RepID=A0A3A8BBJ1_9RHOB|nr:3-hydroxyacyl-CoA dehydrogenase [Roseovarius spongiae]RKF16814.1 3-hydroxyacyl-CoA dehydrogenase [Roseovarius spongiae]